jgi:hypothetical protein
VDARYGQLVDGSPSDNTGYLVPGHGTAFGPPPTKRLSGFGSRAATIYVCYDRYSPAETPDTDKIGWTWSRPPSSITPVPEGGNVQQLQSRYLLRLPAHQVGFVGLALSERLLLSQVRSLAAAAQTDMVELPRITRPARNAHLPAAPVTLTGHLAAGGNGLPTSVTVNGHVAKIRHGSAVAATFSRTLSLGAGWHVLTVRARDAVGNVRTATVRVHVR